MQQEDGRPNLTSHEDKMLTHKSTKFQVAQHSRQRRHLDLDSGWPRAQGTYDSEKRASVSTVIHQSPVDKTSVNPSD